MSLVAARASVHRVAVRLGKPGVVAASRNPERLAQLQHGALGFAEPPIVWEVLEREQILDEIRRCAVENGGKPLGRVAFLRETGIKESWIDRHWLRWSEAVEEAGLTPGTMTTAYTDEHLLDALAGLVREVGHYPVANEYRRKARESSGFPDRKVFDRFGGKSAAIQRLAEFCRERPGFSDVVALLGDVTPTEPLPSRSVTVAGYVYLAKSGRHYKIGQTNDLVRRTSEIRLQLPERVELIHQISTDDPIGIERYWHQRFAHLRLNGEWFLLGADEVAIFKRRKFM